MKLYLIILLACALEIKGAKLSNKKTLKSAPQSAIIAIQIIDPHENKTSSKGSKRTIDSSLGYGYQSIFGGRLPPPRYETYKYSQHDIPPYNGPPPAQYTSVAQSQSYEVQPPASKQTYNTDVASHYQPGTVLFSTIDQRGQLGGLSSDFPVSLENHQFPIPVIILRVHPDQLANPVYPKLPQNHFLASAINSIDINSLLSNHISNNVKQNPAPEYQPQYQETQTYVQPQTTDYQTSDYQSQQYYPQYQYEGAQQNNQNYQSHQEDTNLPEPRSPGVVSQYHVSEVNQPAPIYQQPAAPVNDYRTTELLTHENYPSDKHTQVVFKRSKGKRRNANKSTHRSARVKSTKPYAQPQDTQVQRDEVNDYNPKFASTNTYNPVQTQSLKSQVNDDVNDYNTKYASTNTYNPIQTQSLKSQINDEVNYNTKYATNTYNPVQTQSSKSQVNDEVNNYNTKYVSRNTYNPVQIQSSKSQVVPQENQIQDDRINEYDTKYSVPNPYYTNQYPQDQQSDYRNAPQYGEEQVPDMYQNIQPERETHYIYVTTQPRQQKSDV